MPWKDSPRLRDCDVYQRNAHQFWCRTHSVEVEQEDVNYVPGVCSKGKEEE